MKSTRKPLVVAVIAIVIVSVSWQSVGARNGQPAVQGRAAVPAAADPCATPANIVVAENCRPGNPREEWDINGAGDPDIQGFATDISVTVGDAAQFKIKSHSSNYRIDIYRMGYYGGRGARLIQTMRPSAPLPQAQPECVTQYQLRLVDCGNWAVSASWRVPADAVSGVYVARLVREDNEPESWRAEGDRQPPSIKPAAAPHAYGAQGLGQLRDALKEKRASHIVFVVRDDTRRSAVLFQTSDPTWVALNRYGGSNLEGSWAETLMNVSGGANAVPGATNIRTRAFMVSYNRPLTNRAGYVNDQFFNAEYPLVRWLERNGYDVSYLAGIDSDRRGQSIKDHRLFISAGHDAFWSGPQRTAIAAARDAGVNLAFLSGGEGFWRIRYQASIDGANTPYRTLVCYKESLADGKLDSEKGDWTGAWRDSREFNPLGAQPENALTGTSATVGGFRNDRLAVPARYRGLRLWRNTEVAQLRDGETAMLGKGVLGHEWDEDLDNGARPAGLINMSETTIDNVAYLQDFGATYDSGTATHRLTLYRAPSGALVFGAGTAQYGWALDSLHNHWTGTVRVRPEPAETVKAIQQATVNMFADMGVQPGSRQPELMAAEPSQDKTGPLSKVVSPRSGLAAAATVTVEGTATDSGGVVAGVEVSLDAGTTWHPANDASRPGQPVFSTWRYEGPAPREGTDLKILSRAIDDSVNIEIPGAAGGQQVPTP